MSLYIYTYVNSKVKQRD